MWYTLAKGWVWFALAVLIGIFIGWLLRSIVARRQLLRARGGKAVDPAEADRLRTRVADLESAVVERDRLRAELEAGRAAAAGADGEASGVSNDALSAMPPPEAGSAPERAATAGATTASFAAMPPPDASQSAPVPDVGTATAVLGAAITLDDLKLIEGIGPKIEELCHGIGITTWADLATTEVSLLRTMLNDAGPRFRTHDPGTWPQQAGLLASGRWAEFKTLTDELDGGRPAG